MFVRPNYFQDKVAIVTGGAQGIGKAITQKFLKVGIKVIICDRDRDAGAKTESEFAKFGLVRLIPTDISQEAEVKDAIATTIETFGRLDILVNNAAIANPENPPIDQMSLEEWNQIIAVNLTGAFLCCKYAVPHLQTRDGAIVNIASTRAIMSEPNTEAYSTAKGGIVALTHALANSLGPTIRVNCISPGWINTSSDSTHLTEQDNKQHPVGRVGKPEDVAAMTLYLVSQEASFITGTNAIVDGGMTRKMIYE
ncbi:MAG: SDR family oxidoreductase [Hydrococcus sp. Prado102]|jgi:NAD(P)-dependent dehydrogenase (short-subunit alcohol dehydrogenase family)|nr:SDR family oxidoreductase [Hydrococcus sp. Prado102]